MEPVKIANPIRAIQRPKSNCSITKRQKVIIQKIPVESM
jgi:hypothetical protein